jgi:hypothetical protein
MTGRFSVFSILLSCCCGVCGVIPVCAQKTVRLDLPALLRGDGLETTSEHQEANVRDSAGLSWITVRGILWLKDIDLREGRVDVDLRGRNAFLNSFMGVAFHARDTNAYDVVYFCPFRFHDTDVVTRSYSVKYMSLPDYSYTKLRKTHPGDYEHEADPAPRADEWFHATISIGKEWIAVYVNHSPNPSLRVRRLPTFDSGKVGLWSWSQGLSSDFANLTVTQ